MRGATVLRLHRRPAHEKRRSSAQGERRQWGQLRDVKRPACSKCRPAHGEAAALQHPSQASTCRSCGPAACQPCRGHEEAGRSDRRTPTDWWRTKRRERSVPVVRRRKRSTPNRQTCPASEAINLNRQTGVQRPKRSTPIRQTGVQREKGLSLQPPDWTEDEGPGSTPSFRSALPAKDQRQLRFSSNSLVGDHSGERIILRSCPCNRDHAPRVSMVGNLGKSQTVLSLSRPQAPQKRACGAPFEDCRQIVH